MKDISNSSGCRLRMAGHVLHQFHFYSIFYTGVISKNFNKGL